MEKTLFMDDFECYAEKVMDNQHIPGVGIGLNRDGERVYEKGFGHRNIERGLAVTGDTVFGIASITKSFTCVAIMQLQEAGKLDVNDCIVDYLPDFRLKNTEETKHMTIHHFMTHTSGLPPLATLDYACRRDAKQSGTDHTSSSDELEKSIDTYNDLTDYISNEDVELLGPPGVHFSYSNDAFALLGIVIERVSGVSYETYITDYILKPAGMHSSTFELSELDDNGAITMPYVTTKKDSDTYFYADPIWWDAPAMRAAGFLKSTTNDLLRYTEIYRNKGMVGTNRILSDESVSQMMHPYAEITPGKYYGYGLMVTPDYYGNTLISHSGNLESVTSFFCVVPEKGISGVMLANLAGVPVQDLLLAALNNLQNRDVHDSYIHYEDYSVPTKKLQNYAGTYASNEGMEMQISLEKDKLHFYCEGAYHPIRCIGEDLFLVTINEQKDILQFIPNPYGKVDRASFQLRQLLKA